MPVATRVIGNGGVPAAGTPIAMAAERRGAATQDRQKHLLMLAVDLLVAVLDEVLSGGTNDVGNLQRRLAQALRIGAPWVASKSMSSGWRLRSNACWISADRSSSLQDHDVRAASEWCAGRCLLRADGWRSNDARCVDEYAGARVQRDEPRPCRRSRSSCPK